MVPHLILFLALVFRALWALPTSLGKVNLNSSEDRNSLRVIFTMLKDVNSFMLKNRCEKPCSVRFHLCTNLKEKKKKVQKYPFHLRAPCALLLLAC